MVNSWYSIGRTVLKSILVRVYNAYVFFALYVAQILMSLIFLVFTKVAQRVFFLHEELTKLPSFPRKALEADFNLYKGGAMGKVSNVFCHLQPRKS